ncbi:MAG: filamentous hemagglutinin N-terminal domain-containing protein, partial [Dechloromonas sp.]
MNCNLYRLVFDEEHGSWVPVAEHVHGRGKRHSRRQALLAAMLALAAGMAAAQSTPLPGTLPVPSTVVSRPFVFSGSVVGGMPSVVGNTMTIMTNSRTLGLNWDSFNIASDASVRFFQPNSAARVLNRIWSNDPSVIMGRLDANGQIYLINQNGILFGNGAQVNVGGLIASALNLSPEMLERLLNRGLPTAAGDSLSFAWDGDNAGFAAGFVTVDSGARIASSAGGRVVLLAPRTVENHGTIEGRGIETILAAGGKVVLTVPDDPSLRGLLVETDAFATRDALGNAVKLDGSVSHSGTIDAGNGGVVTLAALAVNQKGLINATRAVNLNGTTMLVAGDVETDRLTIRQRGKTAEIDWLSGFSVGKGKIVEFIQPDSGSVVYNYVYDPDRTAADGSILNQAGRSVIDGVLRATGQFFLINERGVRFAAGADVQAANVVVSALGVNPLLVAGGLFAMDYVDKSGNGQRAFYLNKAQLSAASDAEFAAQAAAGQAAFDAARIDVEAGARIASNVDNGLVMLFGADVAQGGTVTADKGQVLLAAGADVYLKPPFAAGLRGFMAEVNPLYVVRRDAGNAWSVVDHGSIVNRGTIGAALGNISLTSYDIAQLGTLWTSTSATLNGSIRLVARDQVGLSGLASGDDEPPVIAGQRNLDEDGVAPYSSSDFYNPLNKAEQPDFIVGQFGGTLSFGTDSVTRVAIDGSSGKTVTAGQTFISSSIEAIARQIVVDGNGSRGALLEARGGHIDFMASDRFGLFRGFIGDPVAPSQATATPDAGVGIHVESGARLDVSGVVANKSVADLFIRVELRGDEFAGNPVQRLGALRGKTAYVDIRDKVAIADLSGYIAQLGQTVEEKAATGGSIALQSTGSVVVKQGSTLDVSGGGVDYAAATVTESRVLSISGQSYRLNDAPTTAIYYGLQNVTRNEAAYYEGRSAGSVEIAGHSLAVDGNLLATTTRGVRQREIGDPLTNHYATPLGGQLIIRDAGQHFVVDDRQTASDAERLAAYTQAQIAFVRGASNTAAGLQAGDAAGARLELSQSLVDNGFSRFDITSDGRIEVAADVALKLQPGGSFTAAGRQVVVAGDIVAPGGSIKLVTRDMSQAPGLFPTLADAAFSSLILSDGALLSTAGRWANDQLDRSLASRQVLAVDGGSVTLDSAYDIDLRAGSRIDVSGGAQLTSAGKLVAGDAGKITLTTGGIKAAGTFAATDDLDRRDASLFLDGTLAGQALGRGGSLEINTSQVRVGSGTVVDGRTLGRVERLASDQVGIALESDFFDRGGFFDFKLVGRDGVFIDDGTRIAPQPLSWTLEGVGDYRLRASGSNLADFARSQVLHPDRRSAATSLAFATRSLNYGTLSVGEGATLAVTPGGSIDLESWGQLTVLGTLQAAGGTISLSRPANRVDEPYNRNPIEYSEARQAQSIYLGENARLLAGGTTVLTADTRRALEAGNSASALRAVQRYRGEVLAGGTVEIDAGLGYLITREGSLIDVAGAEHRLNVAAGNGTGRLAYPQKTIGSAGGTVSLAAREGMILDGSYAATGRNGAPGGALAVHLYDMASNATWDSLGLPASMQGERSLTLFQSLAGHPAAWSLSDAETARYLAGEQVLASADHNGRAALDLAQAGDAGFGSWYLRSKDEIVFSGSIAGGVANQLQLSASTFRAADDATRVNLQAAAILLGNAAPGGAPATVATGGGATARFVARDIGVIGNFSWNGFATTQLHSSGEIHFDSTANSAPNRSDGRLFSGQMTAAGRLELAAARLSPSTYSDYRIDLSADPDGEILISRAAGASAAESLAVGGRLEFAAPSIVHAGTVTAPLGEIVFSAPGGRVELTADSVTSVAGGRVSLLGETDQSGRYWKYEAAYWDPQTGALRTATYNVERAPEKAIVVDAADSVVASGAQLDLSGGGDALATEFTPGPGGKTDILAGSDGAAPLVFAVLPDWQGSFAPVDSHAMAWYNVSGGRLVGGSWRYSAIPSLKAGDQVYLAANGSGLAAGNYTLLPAAYAKLPGAYLVSVSSTSDSAVAAARPQADGSWLVNGSLLARNADGSTSAYQQGTTTFSVAGQATVDARARYELTALSQFFFDSAGATLPGDAGRLSVVGRQHLTFDPVVTAM